MVLPDPEDIESYLIRMLDLFDQVSKSIGWTLREERVVVGGREAVDAYL